MKQAILTTVVLLTCVSYAMAQTRIEFPYSKSIGMTNGKWDKWESTWTNLERDASYVPGFTVKHVGGGTYYYVMDEGGTSDFTEEVIYDSAETEKIRKHNSNNSLTAYKFADSRNYLWTENITLKQITNDPSSWKSTSNAQIYIWSYDLGSADLYSAQGSVLPAQKYKISFKATKSQIKGTWAEWSSWSTMPRNTYFELKIIRENREYNFKLYENGKLVKNYNITYDPERTKTVRENISSASAYKINGKDGEWIYLLNTNMRNIFSNPDKWSQEKDAVIHLADYKQSGVQTRIK